MSTPRNPENDNTKRYELVIRYNFHHSSIGQQGRSQRAIATMPEERKDTQLVAREVDAQVSLADEDSGEVSAAADHLAAVTLAADKDVARPGTSESQQQDSADELHDSSSDPELWKPHLPTEDCPVCLVPLCQRRIVRCASSRCP